MTLKPSKGTADEFQGIRDLPGGWLEALSAVGGKLTTSQIKNLAIFLDQKDKEHRKEMIEVLRGMPLLEYRDEGPLAPSVYFDKHLAKWQQEKINKLK